ncbi:hypothetical protein SDC9_73311 [bioreactor metagenome]|uniref:Uncharacterized protein n=1 Tax=bioreactor metagenome TaxID=1076179 RepID=A0A644YE80_9ZZZZ
MGVTVKYARHQPQASAVPLRSATGYGEAHADGANDPVLHQNVAGIRKIPFGFHDRYVPQHKRPAHEPSRPSAFLDAFDKFSRGFTEEQIKLFLGEIGRVQPEAVDVLLVLHLIFKPGPVRGVHQPAGSDGLLEKLDAGLKICEWVFASVVPDGTGHSVGEVQIGMLLYQIHNQFTLGQQRVNAAGVKKGHIHILNLAQHFVKLRQISLDGQRFGREQELIGNQQGRFLLLHITEDVKPVVGGEVRRDKGREQLEAACAPLQVLGDESFGVVQTGILDDGVPVKPFGVLGDLTQAVLLSPGEILHIESRNLGGKTGVLSVVADEEGLVHTGVVHFRHQQIGVVLMPGIVAADGLLRICSGIPGPVKQMSFSINYHNSSPFLPPAAGRAGFLSAL